MNLLKYLLYRFYYLVLKKEEYIDGYLAGFELCLEHLEKVKKESTVDEAVSQIFKTLLLDGSPFCMGYYQGIRTFALLFSEKERSSCD